MSKIAIVGFAEQVTAQPEKSDSMTGFPALMFIQIPM